MADGAIEIGSESDEGFYPGEVPAILEEAAKRVSRAELVQHWDTIAAQQAARQQQEEKPTNLVIPQMRLM
jgi:hypothetical protein